MALADQRPRTAARLKGAQIRFGLTDQTDIGENFDLKAKRAGIDFGVIPFNVSGIFQGPDTAQTRRCRDSDALSEFNVGHSAIGLQLGQDSSIDGIKSCSGHWAFLLFSEPYTSYHSLRNNISTKRKKVKRTFARRKAALLFAPYHLYKQPL
jgi:hypothetical protein